MRLRGNHDIRSYKVAEPCWIKADPTFKGLRQIIHEPEDRVYLGDIPPSVARVSRRATRVARLVEIRKLPAANDGDAQSEPCGSVRCGTDHLRGDAEGP